MKSSQALFDEFNRRYWRGRLPRYTVVRRKLTAGLLGRCDRQRRLIVLALTLDGDRLRQTLLHEMCHVGTSGGMERYAQGEHSHGPRFQKKLKRLAALGETVAQDDVEEYDGSQIEAALRAVPSAKEMSFRAALTEDIDALAMSNPRMQWRRAKRVLAACFPGILDQSGDRLAKLAPWAEQEWRIRARDWRAAPFDPKEVAR